MAYSISEALLLGGQNDICWERLRRSIAAPHHRGSEPPTLSGWSQRVKVQHVHLPNDESSEHLTLNLCMILVIESYGNSNWTIQPGIGELIRNQCKKWFFNLGVILIKWDSQVMSNWMWLQFAPYVKSKSRLFWKCQISFFAPNLESVVLSSSQGRFFFLFTSYSQKLSYLVKQIHF